MNIPHTKPNNNLGACHMTDCHYIQALFQSGCAPCTTVS